MTFLEEAQRLLSRFICVYFGYISQRAAGCALVGWWWHHSRRRGDCPHVLIACIQATTLKGAQGVLWWVAMSLRARCAFFPTHYNVVSTCVVYRNRTRTHQCRFQCRIFINVYKHDEQHETQCERPTVGYLWVSQVPKRDTTSSRNV